MTEYMGPDERALTALTVKRCLECGVEPRKPGKLMRLCQLCTDKRFKCKCGKPKAQGAKSCQPCYWARSRGENHHSWKGGRQVTNEGYVRVYAPDHPRRHHNSVLEHILVMEQTIGRPLTADENVHHINGKRDDNRPENLELWTITQPKGQRVSDKIDWAKAILAKYTTPAADQRGDLPAAVDFDGTLAKSLWTPDNPTREIGPPIHLNLVKLRELSRAGYRIVIHTARGWEDESAIRAWMLAHQLPFDSIMCGKLLAAAYIDDRSCHESESSWIPR